MSLETTLNETLTKAIREKDSRVADVVRMLKSRLTERRTAKGFNGTVDDALVLDVISAYRKSLQKALPDYEKAGERGASDGIRVGRRKRSDRVAAARDRRAPHCARPVRIGA